MFAATISFQRHGFHRNLSGHPSFCFVSRNRDAVKVKRLLRFRVRIVRRLLARKRKIIAVACAFYRHFGQHGEDV